VGQFAGVASVLSDPGDRLPRWICRSVRRTFFSALIDRTVTPEELRHELLSLIQGRPATVGKQAPAEHLEGHC
jgi:hypothetical protein